MENPAEEQFNHVWVEQNTERELARLAQRRADVRAQIGVTTATMDQVCQKTQNVALLLIVIILWLSGSRSTSKCCAKATTRSDSEHPPPLHFEAWLKYSRASWQSMCILVSVAHFCGL
jgi:hypothetical protein